jgi:hypothetical protein
MTSNPTTRRRKNRTWDGVLRDGGVTYLHRGGKDRALSAIVELGYEQEKERRLCKK